MSMASPWICVLYKLLNNIFWIINLNTYSIIIDSYSHSIIGLFIHSIIHSLTRSFFFFIQAEYNLKCYGKILISRVPNPTTELLKNLCTDYKPKDGQYRFD